MMMYVRCLLEEVGEVGGLVTGDGAEGWCCREPGGGFHEVVDGRGGTAAGAARRDGEVGHVDGWEDGEGEGLDSEGGGESGEPRGGEVGDDDVRAVAPEEVRDLGLGEVERDL